MLSKRKYRYVAALSAMLVAGFVVTSLVSYFVAHDSIARQVSESTLPLTSDNIYSEIQRDILRPIFISSLMAQDTFLRDWTIRGEQNASQIQRYLTAIQTRYETVTAFYVSERTRRYYHPSGILRTVTDDDPQDQWYKRVRTMKDDYEVNVDWDTADPTRLTVFVNYRVYDYTGGYLGAAGVGLSVSDVRHLIEAYQKRYGRRIFFVDREGNVTLRAVGSNLAESLRDDPDLAPVATKILTSPSGTIEYQRNGDTVYLNSRLIPDFGWYLIVEEPEGRTASGIQSALIWNLAICLAVTLVVVALANLIIGRYQNQLEEMATTDKLTGVANRHAFEIVLDYMLRNARRMESPLAVAMVDIDHFKLVNDRLGHFAGDKVLQTIARIMKENLRGSDSICRWGGEEFLIVLPDCDLNQAQTITDNIRREIENTPVLTGKGEARVTISMGVGQLSKSEHLDDLIRRTDEALYRAKAAGRNRVEPA
ncbi:diguanylate cyclase [Rhodospirillaceae bacterium KN72]|uniref:diguanylate cyclase n=1 Tax=Pacificispira spongiicola TaxID=2729598 RepID=A0A7Y0E354_9PROT|nr:sensor domain-containing diguanylate cyclase [Pacificispira spongiicola]NMM46369.1 diguanylate cyclase [Pacificispira spongiicola]